MARKRTRKEKNAPTGDREAQGELLPSEEGNGPGEKDEDEERRSAGPEGGEPVPEEPEPEEPDRGGAEREEPESEQLRPEESEPEESEPEDDDDDRRSADRAAARSLVEEGRVEEALAAFRRLVDADPGDVKARHNLGVLLDELGRHAEAVEQLETARDMEPESLDVIVNLGAALGAVGRFVDAEKELRRAQRIYPEQVKVRAQLGILYFRRGLYEAAEMELRWVCDRDEGHGPAHFYRGEALNRLGRVDEAMETLERAVTLQPDNPRAYYTLGILFDVKHMPREAAEMYRKARELSRT